MNSGTPSYASHPALVMQVEIYPMSVHRLSFTKSRRDEIVSAASRLQTWNERARNLVGPTHYLHTLITMMSAPCMAL